MVRILLILAENLLVRVLLKFQLKRKLKRVVPIIQAISKEVNAPISIDTYKAEVAKQAIEAGAHIINDIWGAKAEPRDC